MHKEEQKRLLTEIMEADAKDGLYHIGDTNKMVTAVEWFDNQMQSSIYLQYDNVGKRVISIPIEDYMELKQESKKIEKEQIKQAYVDSPTYALDSEQYYNYKYGK
jgi:hypothetical protein